MADSGLVRFLGSGIRLASSSAATNYVGHRITANPATSFYINWLTALPGSTQALTIDASGNISTTALGGGGTVTSVALSLPSIFSVTGSPVTTTGTLTGSLATQTANTVFAGPTTGGAVAPTFRTLVAADIPTLTASIISNFDTQVRTSRLDQMAAPTASVSFNSQKITSLLDPTSAQDAATKNYVDSVATGLDVKASVQCATIANITLSGEQTIDGVTTSSSRVLVKNQSNATQNGIYVSGTGAWTRATDADTSSEVTSGMFTFVEQGTVNGTTGWVLGNANPITLGTTNLTFVQFSGAGTYLAGNGLSLTGSSFAVLGTTNRISVSGSGVDISAAYVGQTSITTLGTIATGVWNGTTIAVANGGTGATTAAAARTNLVVPSIYRTSFTSASLVSNVLTVTHSLGQQIVKVQVSDNNNAVVIPDGITLTSTTQCTVDLTSFATISGTWNVVVVG